MTDWVIVPVKSIANGKSRLAPILGRQRRQRLNREMLARTLFVAAAVVGMRHVIVVSHCPETRRIAGSLGIRTLREPRGIGLNRGLDLGRRFAVSRGGSGVLIIPSDLPLVFPMDLRHVLRLGRRSRAIVICRDRHGRGTNALYLKRPYKFRFRFGENSAKAHCDEATMRARIAFYLDTERLGFDLDTPSDYQDLRMMTHAACRYPT